ncbi:uncharacterized protein NH340_JMT07979 [Sarcoptes scabiei]|nr:uncharacterized protein NH340_JMT07979 [Sarcoptes scabiei]
MFLFFRLNFSVIFSTVKIVTLILVLSFLTISKHLGDGIVEAFVDESIENKTFHRCPIELENRCDCGLRPYNGQLFSSYLGSNRPTFVTNCSDSKFNHSSILKFIPLETEILIFTGNHFEEFDADSFNQNYSKLLIVDLSKNSIKRIHSNSFRPIRSAKILLFDHNQIDLSDFETQQFLSNFDNLEELYLRDCFNHSLSPSSSSFTKELLHTLNRTNLNRLKSLNLARNHIEHLWPRNFFCNLNRSLNHLFLGHNSLTEFSLNLSCFEQLKSLDLSSNQIETIDNRSLRLMLSNPGQYRLNLTENPLQCDCRLKNFYQFIHNQTKHEENRRSKIIFDWYEELRCRSNKNIDQDRLKYLDEIDESDLVCNDRILFEQRRETARRYRYYVTLSYLVLGFLLAILFTLIAVLIYTNRKVLTTCWNILWADFNYKRNYSVLDKDFNVIDQQDNVDGEIDDDQLQNDNRQNHHRNNKLSSQSNGIKKTSRSNRSKSNHHQQQQLSNLNDKNLFDIAEEQL